MHVSAVRRQWPTNLTPQTYHYAGHWPGKGESRDTITQHYLTAPYIGDGLSTEYKDAFAAVEKQFIEHFAAKGWNRTEMQCFFGGKNTHRIDYGSNLWWTTDEPMHWDDWLALQFFDRLWTQGRGMRGPADLAGPRRHLPAAVDGPDARRRHRTRSTSARARSARPITTAAAGPSRPRRR